MKTIQDYITTIPDFPKPGILFRDITSVLTDPEGLALSIHELEKLLEGVEYDVIVGLESRGFLFGTPIAYDQHKAFVPARKKGKLPRETVSADYELEYGTASIELHKDAIRPGQRVVILDDLIATGGTARAAAQLVEALGGSIVKMIFLIELSDLKGRELLCPYSVASVVSYEGM